MNKYFIFRTDRIGDFLLTLILIKCIKRNDENSHITVISSNKNHEYIKTFDLVDKVYILKSDYLSKYKLIKKLRQSKFNFSIIHDGKNRSFFINFFLNKLKTLKVDNNDISISHYAKIKKILKILNFELKNNDLNTLDNRFLEFKDLKRHKYLIFHFDEKWSKKFYISDYKNIEPSEIQLLKFLMNLKSIVNHNIIITTGLNTPLILKNVISKINDDKIELFENLNFLELEYLVSNSNLIISCHGAISHVASAHQIKQIDIIDTNIRNPYINWTDHFRNYYYIYRNDFEILSKKIYELIKDC